MIDLKKYADSLCSIVRQLGSKNLLQVAIFLRQRIYQPDSYVVLLGESCSGKSTMINSIIRQGILPVRSVPSTGTITEIYLDETACAPSYAVINKNATMELLEYNDFCNLALNPDAEVARLRATLSAENFNMAGVRLFDTPGYGSMITEHDEVLVDFLPNCDAVIYMVNYRIGIQETDYEFLRKLKELTRDGIPLYLVINRCPANITTDDRRITEIYRNVISLLRVSEIPFFMIPSVQVKNSMIQCQAVEELREKFVCDLNSPRRREELDDAFKSYLDELSALIRIELERQIRNLQMSSEEEKIIQEEMKQLASKFQYAVDDIVKPGFEMIQAQLPKRINESRKKIEDTVCSEIEKQPAAGMDETIAYINTHLLPFRTREESEEIQHYLTVELDDIDKKVNDYLNKAVIEFERDIELRFSSAALQAGAGVVKNVAGKLLNSGLLSYFAKFGGRGGAGAGMANAASHLLKKVGDLFGKTFSRETHNAVKHIMKKIGLTSTKTLGTAVAGILEVASMAIEYGTWKPVLTQKVKKGLDNWESEILSLIKKDLDKLEQENINMISSIAKSYADAFAIDKEPEGDIDALYSMLQSLEEIEKGMNK